MDSRTTHTMHKNQVLPQQEHDDEQGAPIQNVPSYDLIETLVKDVIPCLVFAGYVVLAIIQAIQGDPDYGFTILTGFFVAMLSVPVAAVVILLGAGMIWLLCCGGVYHLTIKACNAVRSTTCPPPRPSPDDAIGACVIVGMCLFWNGITWFMVVNVFFVSKDGLKYSLDPDVPIFLIVFFLPFVLIGVSVLLFCLFGGPLRHLSYYILCCCCCPSARTEIKAFDLEMTKLEGEDETVASDLDEERNVV
mmetsp:Transcript_9316/g.15482  ORF Transcript_9316/g.15482 Transcript_9316/m.15482 type:complete len:248 (+) Transcript_9316:138-881(+)